MPAFLSLVGVLAAAYWAYGGRRAARSADSQLTPNGGASVADAIKRIEATIARVEERQMLTDRVVARLAEDIHQQITPPYGIPPTKKENPQ